MTEFEIIKEAFDKIGVEYVLRDDVINEKTYIFLCSKKSKWFYVHSSLYDILDKEVCHLKFWHGLLLKS